MPGRAYFKCECGLRFRSTLQTVRRRRFCPACKLEVYDLYRVETLPVGRPNLRMAAFFKSLNVEVTSAENDCNCQISTPALDSDPAYEAWCREMERKYPKASSTLPDSGITKLSPRDSAEWSAR